MAKKAKGKTAPAARKKVAPATDTGMPIERVRLDMLHLDPANARKHGQRNLETIRASLKQFGQVEPLVVQKSSGRIIGGNGRFETMRQMGMAEADVVMLDIGDTQATALGITLNRTAELAEWDLDVLQDLVQSLPEGMADDMALSVKDLDALGASPIPDFDPEGEAAALDKVDKKPIACPECGHMFSP